MLWMSRVRYDELMNPPRSKLDRIFYISLGIKAFDGVLQIVGGTLLLFLKPSQIDSHLQFLTVHAADNDADDVFFRSAANFFHHLTGGTLRFAAIYLIADAIIKLVLIYEVLHKRYW